MAEDRRINRKVFLASAGASLAALATLGSPLWRPRGVAARRSAEARLPTPPRDPRSVVHGSGNT
ncbi:MAG: hypothetical protein JJU00_08365 [Opitutales bacterium]|nr:hypothetical protein [Opitutales bacterium]